MITDREILTGIAKHDHHVLEEIYREFFPYIENLVLQHGGSEEEARDVFQDGMIIVYQKIESDALLLKCKFSTYFYAVCKKIWIQERKKQLSRLDKLKQIHAVADPSHDYIEREEDDAKELLYKHFAQLSEECQKILKLYFNGLNMEEIRQVLEMKTVHHTSDKKYRCKKNLVDRVMNDPLFEKLKR